MVLLPERDHQCVVHRGYQSEVSAELRGNNFKVVEGFNLITKALTVLDVPNVLDRGAGVRVDRVPHTMREELEPFASNLMGKLSFPFATSRSWSLSQVACLVNLARGHGRQVDFSERQPLESSHLTRGGGAESSYAPDLAFAHEFQK